MTAHDILRITKPGDLFSFEKEKRREEYLQLAKEYHPDSAGLTAGDGSEEDRTAVFEKVSDLYREAERLAGLGFWEKTGLIRFTDEAGRRIECSYLKILDFELGWLYIGRRHVLYRLTADREKFYTQAVKMITGISYLDAGLQKEFEPCLPKLVRHCRLSDGTFLLVLEKESDVYPAGLLQNCFHGAFPARHAAWIISRLCSLSCFLSVHGLVHNGMTLDNCFLSPAQHRLFLYGGWWYSGREGEKMTGVSREVFEIMPVKARTEKCCLTSTDLETVKLTGRRLCGEANSFRLKEVSGIPDGMKEFLTGGSSNDAAEEMRRWDAALERSFGPRKFIKMEISEQDIFKKEN